jgi:hypothetical protein
VRKHILYVILKYMYPVPTDQTDTGNVPLLSRFADLLLPSLSRNHQSFGEEEMLEFQNNCIFLQHPLSIKSEHLSSQYCTR